jgi:hypothetical protein
MFRNFATLQNPKNPQVELDPKRDSAGVATVTTRPSAGTNGAVVTRPRSIYVLAALASALLLSGCTLGDTAPDLPDKADVQLHPVGDPGLWFDNGYSLGVSDIYATPNTVCGITDGVIVEFEEGPDFSFRVVARVLPGDQIAWEIADSRCSAGSTMDGTVVVSPWGDRAGETTLDVVNVATGGIEQTIQREGGGTTAIRVSQVDNLRILRLDNEILVGADGDGIVWTTSESQGGESTPLGDGHIAISDGLEGWIRIIDARTGEETLPRTNMEVNDITWASDGYVLRVNQSDPEYAFFDLHGKEVDRTVGESQFGFFPRPDEGLTFPLADHIAAGTVTGVDATGVPAVFSGDTGHGIYLRGGKLDESQGDLLWSQGVSADGSLVLSYDDGDGFALYDVHGKARLSWPLADELRVEDGYIVFSTDNSTQVLIPGS